MFKFFRKKQHQGKQRVVVLGIDGVPCTLLERFMQEGMMPNLSGLVSKGTLLPMTASIPEVSSTSWTTFMTGVNPGRHGIYGFMELQDGSYKWRFPNSGDIKSPTLWDIAGKNDKKSVVINVPSTYPAKTLNGILTAGFVALDLKKATYPDSAYEYLKGIGYKMDVDTRKAQESAATLADDIQQAFEIRKRAIFHFMDNEDWDLFISVVTETDRLHHYLWVALNDSEHPQHSFFLDFYRMIDEFIGELYRRTGDDVPFFIISDHGFTTIKREVYLNVWLREKGYLQFKSDQPQSMEDMMPESKVFVLDPARFYIHREGKYPRGTVKADEYTAIREGLRSDLLEMTHDGEQIIKTVLFKEDLYKGEVFDTAPDVVVLPHEGFDLKGAINKTEVFGNSFLTGGHTRENAVFYINRQVSTKDVNIIDVAPTVMALLGIDGSFDGKCLI